MKNAGKKMESKEELIEYVNSLDMQKLGIVGIADFTSVEELRTKLNAGYSGGRRMTRFDLPLAGRETPKVHSHFSFPYSDAPLDAVVKSIDAFWNVPNSHLLITESGWTKTNASKALFSLRGTDIVFHDDEALNYDGLLDRYFNAVRFEPDIDGASAKSSTTEPDPAVFRKNLNSNRLELPPTLDAMMGFIDLEISRLQNRNFRSEDDKEECVRQIQTLTTIHRCALTLSQVTEGAGDISESDLEVAKTSVSALIRAFKEWPKANADDLADKTIRGSIVLAFWHLLVLCGVDGTPALAAAMVLFGNKEMAETLAKFTTKSSG